MAPTLGNGKICYIEIPANDIQRSAEFYEKVFGWLIGLPERMSARRRTQDNAGAGWIGRSAG